LIGTEENEIYYSGNKSCKRMKYNGIGAIRADGFFWFWQLQLNSALCLLCIMIQGLIFPLKL